MNAKTVANIVLSFISLSVSAIFVWAGASMVSGAETPMWIRAFGMLTAIYGVMNTGLLLFAWLRATLVLERIAKYLAIVFLLLIVVASLDVGMISGLEWVGILLAAFMLFLSWLAVKRVVEVRHVA
jgi:hypothetical protein